ncbi:hypothetical protein CYMTET_42813 [Cymbomonas tetramitiformis]|uniref:Uncharacterized protein n=1 Tax=Cymbomonas tetramitiformis TaxID=36881 RepID=A0AAE0C3F9_9CHLO|nr:hypothetical protein CYMTET_42813 [Cymbomonas tetramitiformis]
MDRFLWRPVSTLPEGRRLRSFGGTAQPEINGAQPRRHCAAWDQRCTAPAAMCMPGINREVPLPRPEETSEGRVSPGPPSLAIPPMKGRCHACWVAPITTTHSERKERLEAMQKRYVANLAKLGLPAGRVDDLREENCPKGISVLDMDQMSTVLEQSDGWAEQIALKQKMRELTRAMREVKYEDLDRYEKKARRKEIKQVKKAARLRIKQIKKTYGKQPKKKSRRKGKNGNRVNTPLPILNLENLSGEEGRRQVQVMACIQLGQKSMTAMLKASKTRQHS